MVDHLANDFIVNQFIGDFIFFLLGCVMLLIEIIVLVKRRYLRRKMIKTKGKIVKKVRNQGYVFPVIEFQGKNGKIYRVTSTLGYYSTMGLDHIFMKQGRQCTIYYHPTNPEKIIHAFGWIGSFIVIIISIISTLLIIKNYHQAILLLLFYLQMIS